MKYFIICRYSSRQLSFVCSASQLLLSIFFCWVKLTNIHLQIYLYEFLPITSISDWTWTFQLADFAWWENIFLYFCANYTILRSSTLCISDTQPNGEETLQVRIFWVPKNMFFYRDLFKQCSPSNQIGMQATSLKNVQRGNNNWKRQNSMP